MLLVSLDQAQPGMALATPVTHPLEPGRVLLKPGFTLRSSVMESLRGLGVSKLCIEFPGMEAMGRHVSAAMSSARQAVYFAARQSLEEAAAGDIDSICFEECYRSARTLTETLRAQGPRPLYIDLLTSLSNDTAAHSAAVTHLALMLGLQLEDYLLAQRKNVPPQHAREVVNLGVASMLHEIGKVQIPCHLRRYHVAYLPKQDQVADWERHAALGHAMIQGKVESSAACAVLHHHYRFDGKTSTASARAVPAGQKIHIHGRILAAADLFHRLSRPRTGLERSNLEVYHLMRTQHDGLLDPAVIRTLIRVAPPFMPGGKIVLPDGVEVVCIGADDQDPFAPVVRRLDRDGVDLCGESMTLAACLLANARLADGTPVRPYLPEQSWWKGLAA